MRFFHRAVTVAAFVFRALWLILASAVWIYGIKHFLSDKTFSGWLIWGIACAIPLCAEIVKQAISSGRDGRDEGANEYTVTVTDTSVTVHDNSVSGAVWGFVGGLIGGVLVGPVVLPLFFVGHLGAFIGDIIHAINNR